MSVWLRGGFELQWAIRRLRRRGLVALGEVALLGCGLGLAASAFLVFRAVVLQPLPYADAGRLVSVSVSRGRGAPAGAYASWPDANDWRRCRALSDLAAIDIEDLAISGGPRPREARVGIVSSRFFRLFGTAPVVGRTWTGREQRAGRALAVLSYPLWQAAFGGDPSAIGKTIAVAGASYKIVGVAPRGFAFPVGPSPVQLWLSLAAEGTGANAPTKMRDLRFLRVFARLHEGFSAGSAAAQLHAVAQELAAEFPATNAGLTSARVIPLRQWVAGSSSAPLALLLASGLFLAVVGTADVLEIRLAGEELSRAEAWVCAALGAGSRAWLWRAAADALALGVPASAVALLVAELGAAVARRSGLPVPRLDTVTATPTQMALTAAAAIACGALVATVAAPRPRRKKTVGQRGLPLRLALPAALSAVLFVASAASLASYRRLLAGGPSFPLPGLIEISVDPPPQSSPRAALAFYHRLVTTLRSLPSTRGAAVASSLPFGGDETLLPVSLVGGGRAAPVTADVEVVSPGYFRVLGVSDPTGGALAWRGTGAVASSALAKALGAPRLRGRQVEVHMQGLGAAQYWVLVGDVADVRDPTRPVGRAAPVLYLPPTSRLFGPMKILLRAVPGQTAAAAAQARRTLARVAPEDPAYGVRTVGSVLKGLLAPAAFQLGLMVALAGVTILLAAAGLWGAVAHGASLKRRELAIMAALGASPARLVRAAAGRAAAWGATGAAGGGGAAILVTRFWLPRSGIIGIALNFRAELATVAIVAVAAGAAALIPALSAARRCPGETLRQP